MRGTKVKRIKKETRRPNPGRKFGGLKENPLKGKDDELNSSATSQ